MELKRSSVQDWVAKGAKDVRPPTIEEAFAEASAQLKKGYTAGERKTPVFSVWPLTLKKTWKQFGGWWTVFSPDGDIKFVQGVGPVEPLMLQLFYVKISEEEVLQLAWERPDIDFRASRNVISERGEVFFDGH